jgi:hypothetical protein
MADQGLSREGRGEEQPKDKERAQTAHKTANPPIKDNQNQIPEQQKQRSEGGHHLPPHATENPMDDTDRNSDKVIKPTKWVIKPTK